MLTKSGKKIKNKNFKNLKVVTGTIDNKNPKSVYFNISGWALPINDDDINYKRLFNDIEKKIKSLIFNNLDTSIFHSNKFIVDFDMRESGIRVGTKSYINCDVTLFQKHLFKIQNKKIQESLEGIIQIINDKIFISSKYFLFTKNKK